MQINRELDANLIQSYLDGDQGSLEVLFNKYRDKLYTYIFFLVRKQEIAEDVFQETFYKAIQSLKAGKYKDDGRFFPWLSRIAHNMVIDHFRAEKKMNNVSHSEENENSYYQSSKIENIEDEMEQSQKQADVKKILAYLPDEQREVVVMRHYLDMSFKEISSVTGVSINTALGRMRYALLNMKKIIEENNIPVSL